MVDFFLANEVKIIRAYKTCYLHKKWEVMYIFHDIYTF